MPLRSEKKAPNLKPVVDPNNPVKPGFWPASVAFWDAENGLLAGRLYLDEGRSRSDGAVAMTHDGGTSWRLAYRTNSQVDGLAVVGERTAFATLGYGNTKIITTGDSGRTWKDWPGSQELSQPSFQTPETGWAVSDRGLMAWSSGRWAPIPDPCEGVVVDLSFPEGGDGRGWLACSFEGGAGQEPKAIYETTDALGTSAPASGPLAGALHLGLHRVPASADTDTSAPSPSFPMDRGGWQSHAERSTRRMTAARVGGSTSGSSNRKWPSGRRSGRSMT
jgi:hypothetical protein